MATSRIADSVGRVLGDRYRLTRPLGLGASAHVYLAEDVELRRRVAIKVLHPALAADERFLRRFRAEARAVASLRHPNILTVYDWGEDGGSAYLVMELLGGGSLRSLLDRGLLLSPAQAARVGADAARALDYAHRRGLVHRDVKPANLIFDDEGRVTVADFGLARALAEATWTEPAGAVVGTARYAAPEQVRGERLDSRADVYSLAIVLVEAVTGLVPFSADTTIGTLMARVDRPLEVPPEAGPLGPCLEAAGTPDPSERLDAAALANRLDRVASRLPAPLPIPVAAAAEAPVDAVGEPTQLPPGVALFDGEACQAASHDRPPIVLPEPEPARAPRRRPPRPQGRHRHRARLAAAAGVLLVLAGAGAAAATGAFTPSRPVPDLVGDTEAQAAAALRPLHLHLRVASTRYAAVRRGTVVGQEPARGRLKEGDSVSVVLSDGPRPVAVPHGLVGVPVGVAEALLRSAGLSARVGGREPSMTIGAGSVVSAQPSGGTLLPGQAVTVVVSSGRPRVPVPSLAQGSTFADARAVLAQAHLVAREQTEYSDTVPAGGVVGTVPTASSSVAVGSEVTVLVSKGPPLVVVPDVAGESVTAATGDLTARGFVVTGVGGNPTAPVAGTSPPYGTYLREGAGIQILTG